MPTTRGEIDATVDRNVGSHSFGLTAQLSKFGMDWIARIIRPNGETPHVLVNVALVFAVGHERPQQGGRSRTVEDGAQIERLFWGCGRSPVQGVINDGHRVVQ